METDVIRYCKTCFFVLLLLSGLSFAAPPKNVILLIGDGMGPEQVKAAGIYAQGDAGTLSFESMPYQADCTTYSADSSVTDSAASATAIATGYKVNNKVISIADPGDGSELETLLEYFKTRGKSSGLVTTVYVSHATPAAFGAHQTNRNNYTNIISDYLNRTLPNVLMGGTRYISSSAAEAAGYTVVTDHASMAAIDPNTVDYLSGQFGGGDGYALPWEYDGNFSTQPHLSEMTASAIDILDNNENGFFLMIEGGLIDWACHDNDDGGIDGANAAKRMIHETIEFSDTVQIALNWASQRTDTLVIVTADHETGGLTVTANNGQGVYPTVTWSTGGHTGANVGVYAQGVNAHLVSGTMDNTDFFNLCTTDELSVDLDGDNGVDLIDFSELSRQWQISKFLSDLMTLAEFWLYGTDQ